MLRRVLGAIALGLVVLVLAVGGWAVFWLLWNPRVALAPPRVETRPARGPEVTVVLGGDFAPTDAAMPLLRERGWHYPYEATAALLRDADVAFANLEAPVTESHRRFPLPKEYIYRVEPEATEAFRWLGLDVVSLANNHVGDYRDQGLLDTVRHLDEAGIAHVGGGATETAARQPVIFDVGGTKVGFLAYMEDKVGYNLYLRAYAVGDRVGCAKLERTDVAEDVRRLRPLVDVLIVSVHWGENYKDVTPNQESLGRYLASLGVDVVAGHHPHDFQPAEVSGRTVILYSLGNYAWGAPGHGELRLGLLARLRIAEHRLAGVEILPIVTQNRIVRFQPRPLVDGELPWLARFVDGTRRRGTAVTVRGTTVELTLPR